MEYLTKHQERIWNAGKSCRDLRYRDFSDVWYYEFAEVCRISKHTYDGWSLEIPEMAGSGIVDFYPKSNKILIRQQNKWINNGLEWLIKKLLK